MAITQKPRRVVADPLNDSVALRSIFVLFDTGAIKSKADFARRVGVSEQRVQPWLAGRGKPDAASRARVQDVLGIAVRDWDRQPTPASTAEDASAERAHDEVLPSVADQSEASAERPAPPVLRTGSPLEQTEQILADVRAQIAVLRAAASDAKRKDLASLSNALRNYISKEADLVRQLAEIEDSWAKSVSYNTLLDRIIDALAEVPGGLDALESALV